MWDDRASGWTEDPESAEGGQAHSSRRSGSPLPALILLVAFGLSMVLCCLAAGRTAGLLDVDPAHLW
ncbi:MAG: hypothetical protein ACM30G_06710 [Micromonosporaceae bacterium]